MPAALKRIKNARSILFRRATETRGHLTTGMPKFYAHKLDELLQTAPHRAM